MEDVTMMANFSILVLSKYSLAVAADAKRIFVWSRIEIVLCFLFSSVDFVLCGCGRVIDTGVAVSENRVFQCKDGVENAVKRSFRRVGHGGAKEGCNSRSHIKQGQLH